MRKYLYGLAAALLIIIGCSSEDGDNNPAGLGGVGNNNGGDNVTFTVDTIKGEQGVFFLFKPSVNVTITSITAALPDLQFEDVIQGDETTVFNTQDGFFIGEYTGVETGQKWVFTIAGKTADEKNENFNVETNFTVP